MISVIFFGSFKEFSVLTLKSLLADANIKIVTVVTSPARPGNRGQITPNPIQTFSESQNLPVLSPSQLKTNLPPLPPADFIFVAGYGLLIPPLWLNHPRYLSLNAHPSLLPQYPGRFPVEWALLMGEDKIGLSLISMTSRFDSGQLVFQQPLPIAPQDNHLSLYRQTYLLAGQIAPQIMSQIITGSLHPWPQVNAASFYARGVTRQDGFIPFPVFLSLANSLPFTSSPWPLLAEINHHLAKPITTAELISRMDRAFHPWPGLWTQNLSGTRLIVRSLSPLLVQPEGKKPAAWAQLALYYS